MHTPSTDPKQMDITICSRADCVVFSFEEIAMQCCVCVVLLAAAVAPAIATVWSIRLSVW
jgi:hypothetical protein